MFKKSQGVTLVEILVVTVLASMVMGSAMGIWSYSRRNMSRTSARQVLQQDATRILTQLQADLKAAKAETFQAKNDPLSLEFTRYVVSPDDSSKLSNEMTQNVKYVFAKPILRRLVDGKGAHTLSNYVENIVIDRKELSAEAKVTDQYLEARVNIALEMGKRAMGTDSDEKFLKHTSVVIRDEFYSLANKERSDVFEDSKEVADELVKANDSSFFSDVLDADSLKNLTDEQLDDLEKTQETNLKDAKEGLEEINDRIAKIDSGEGWFNHWWWRNEDAADVEGMKTELKKLKCSDKDIPEKGSGERASEKAEAIIKRLDDKIKTLESTFMNEAYSGDLADPNSDNDEVKTRADLQKRAYDMRVTDRQIQAALDEMSDEEKTEAEANGSMPRKMIDQYSKTAEQIRTEIVGTGIVEDGSDELNTMVAQEVAKMAALKKEYDACDLGFLTDGKTKDGTEIEEKSIKAYEGAKQLKSLAESKMETFKLKELSIDNVVEINKARELKKESLEDEAD